jgi:isochorismate hydrolase
MSSQSGFPTSKKSLSSLVGYTSEQTSTKSQFVTIEPTGSDRVAQTVSQRALYSVSTANAVATSPNKRSITCTGLTAKKDDILRFTSRFSSFISSKCEYSHPGNRI